jgi:hypothetical protein
MSCLRSLCAPCQLTKLVLDDKVLPEASVLPQTSTMKLSVNKSILVAGRFKPGIFCQLNRPGIVVVLCQPGNISKTIISTIIFR